jgi:hypothetical protein
MGARQFGAKLEARRSMRRLVDLQCDVFCELWGEAIVHRVTDLSEDGLWIETELLLEVGTEVTLSFYPPDWEEPLWVAGRVERVELRPQSPERTSVGMGIGFESLRNDERRRLTQSMRGLRAQESFILGQRTLTGVPIGIDGAGVHGAGPVTGGTLAGWTAPSPARAPAVRPSRITATPAEPRHRAEDSSLEGFPGGLDLAASVFATDSD